MHMTGEDDPASLEVLQAVQEHRAVGLLENTRPHLDRVVRDTPMRLASNAA